MCLLCHRAPCTMFRCHCECGLFINIIGIMKAKNLFTSVVPKEKQSFCLNLLKGDEKGLRLNINLKIYLFFDFVNFWLRVCDVCVCGCEYICLQRVEEDTGFPGAGPYMDAGSPAQALWRAGPLLTVELSLQPKGASLKWYGKQAHKEPFGEGFSPLRDLHL